MRTDSKHRNILFFITKIILTTIISDYQSSPAIHIPGGIIALNGLKIDSLKPCYKIDII
jgi:hypothetical protein